jgi:hypothetical protein
LGVNGNISGTGIALTVPYGTDVTALTPTVTITGASVSPLSGVLQDFTNPVTYTVTAANGTTKSYTVTVTVAAPSSIATVTSTTYTVSLGGTASEDITDVSFRTSKTGFLSALTKGESNQTWDVTAISDPVVTGNTLVVTAQDGTTAVTYTVTARTSYILRDTGPAGGLIFYVNPNYATDGWRYLEAAPSDQSTGIQWRNGTVNVVTGATGVSVGTGQANTTAIVSAQGAGSYAAQLCDALTAGGYSDWFMPSKDELNLMYVELKAHGVGGFNGSAGYWSSSELDFQTAAYQGFSGGGQSSNYKHSTYPIRAARAFSKSYIATLNYTGGEQQWAVPAGVTSVQVDVKGAQGGSAGYGVPGKGGRVQTTLIVTPGETLYVYVGGQGGYNSGPGGYNGGGACGGPTGAGGGASDIRQGGNTLADRVVVAGGGGGDGYYWGTNGGSGGYPEGGGGGNGTYGGGGGTQTAGGAGGIGYKSGTAGSLGIGGTFVGAGAGGGGGYYGGGGGGTDMSAIAGAGGGGSSNSQGTSTTYTDGYQSGNGQIAITYTY